MSMRDDGKLCRRCKEAGLNRLAHRIMPNGEPLCDEHYRDECGLPQLDTERSLFIKNLQSTSPRPKKPKKPRKASPDIRDLLERFYKV